MQPGEMDRLCEKLGCKIKNKRLLEEALTHSSYANENKEKGAVCNERLEFLGDAVLNMTAAAFLFERFPALPEGELTMTRAALVCEASLCRLALGTGLGKYLVLGKGEDNNGGRERASILADAAEAVIAALYLDGGLDAVRGFVVPFLEREVEGLKSGAGAKDYKTKLQELVQKNRQETLRYELTGEHGPDHEKVFTVTLYLNSNPIAEGEGKSKKEAEQQAAAKGLALMGEL